MGLTIMTAKELMYELAEYLSRRYPLVYSVSRFPISSLCVDQHILLSLIDYNEKKYHSNSESNQLKGIGYIDGWYSSGRIRTITIIPNGVTFYLEEEEPNENIPE